jgi:hypothetical protein
MKTQNKLPKNLTYELLDVIIIKENLNYLAINNKKNKNIIIIGQK